jgi:hypothetical protein
VLHGSPGGGKSTLAEAILRPGQTRTDVESFAMRRGAVVALVILACAALVALVEVKEQDGPSDTASANSADAAVIDLGRPVMTDIGGLPVPASATPTSPVDRCAGAAECRDGRWFLPRSATGAAVIEWYTKHVPAADRGDWKLCGADLHPGLVGYQWHGKARTLWITVAPDEQLIEMHEGPADLGCQ